MVTSCPTIPVVPGDVDEVLHGLLLLTSSGPIHPPPRKEENLSFAIIDRNNITTRYRHCDG